MEPANSSANARTSRLIDDAAYLRHVGRPLYFAIGSIPIESSDATAQAIEQLYCLYYQPVLHYLDRLIQQHESAEDLCQETFLKVFRHRDQLREVACVGGWLYRIATNTAYYYLRRQRRIAFTAPPDEATQTATTPMETRWDDAEPVWDALCRISAHYRVPLVLKSIVGYSLDNIAATLGCSPTSAKTRVHRGASSFASTTLLDMTRYDRRMSFAH